MCVCLLQPPPSLSWPGLEGLSDQKGSGDFGLQALWNIMHFSPAALRSVTESCCEVTNFLRDTTHKLSSCIQLLQSEARCSYRATYRNWLQYKSTITARLLFYLCMYFISLMRNRRYLLCLYGCLGCSIVLCKLIFPLGTINISPVKSESKLTWLSLMGKYVLCCD